MRMTNMASSSTLLSQINQDFLTCQICMDTYKQPKVLNCQHTFCLDCLESCNKNENGSYMVCPICRQKTVLGMQGVKGLKHNFVFSNMIEMLGTWKKSRSLSSPTRSMDSIDNSVVMCGTCPTLERTMATFQCLDCLDQLCVDCAAFHSRTKLTKGHEVVSLEEIETGKHGEKLRFRELNKCHIHENVQMQHYCEKCRVPICRDCILENHQSHPYISLEEAEEKQRENVQQIKSELEEEIKTLENSLNNMRVLESRQEETKVGICEQIQNMTRDLVEEIREQEAILLNEVDRTLEVNSEKIRICKDGLNTQLNCVENCIQFSDCVLKDGAAVEIITMHGQLTETVKQLQSKSYEVETRSKAMAGELTEIRFEHGDLSSLSTIVGRITTTKTEAEQPAGAANQKEAKETELTGKSLRVQMNQVTLPPKPSPRVVVDDQLAESSKTLHFTKKPQPVKRRNKVTRMATSFVPNQRQSVLEISQKISGDLAKSSTKSKSVTNLTAIGGEEFSNTKSEMKRPAPPPPGHRMGSQPEMKKTSPKKTKAPLPPPKPPKKPLTPQHEASTHSGMEEPIKASKLLKFGKKGKVITSGEFVGPPKCAIFSGPKKRILVLDSDNRHVLVFTLEGWFKKSFKVALPNQGSYPYKSKIAQMKPVAIAETSTRHLLVLFKNFVTMWSWDGNMEHVWGTADLTDATSITTDSRGRILISDQERHMVFVYDEFTRQKVLQFGGFGDRVDLLKSPRYICTNEYDNIIVSDHHNNCIKVFSPEGEFLYKFGEKGVENGQLRYPESVACLKLEDGENSILVADDGNRRVSLFNSAGDFINHVLTENEDKCLKSPQFISVSLDGRGEELLVLQTNNIQIRIYRLFQFLDRTS